MRPTTLTPQEVCRKLKPIIGKKADQLFLSYSFADDPDKKRELEGMMSALFMKYMGGDILGEKILLEPPAGEMDGEFELGQIQYTTVKLGQFRLREMDFPRHICITGMSGSGKTNMAFLIVKQLTEKRKPFLILDWKKSFRPLLIKDKDIMLYSIGNPLHKNAFKVNINKPPQGVSPKEWITILSDTINESFFASHGTHKLITETLNEAFQDFGVYNGSNNYPTWMQIKDRLEDKKNDEKNKGRASEWLTSAIRIAHELTFGYFGESINYKGAEEIKIQDLLDKKVIFELFSLGSSQKKFFGEYLLTYIFKYLKAVHKKSGRRFNNAIIVDEAHNIFLKDRPQYLKETVTDMIYREIREYGTSMICLDQHISKLSETVSGNSACVIAFQQVLPQDVQTVANLMQIYENRHYFSMLEVGQAIVRLAERYHQPFLIQTPLAELKDSELSESAIDERMSPITKRMTIKELILASRTDAMDSEKKKLARVAFDSGSPGQLDPYPDMSVAPKPVINRDRFLEKHYAESLGNDDMQFPHVRTNLENNPQQVDALNPRFNTHNISRLSHLQLTQKETTALATLQKESMTTSQLYKSLGLSGRKGQQLRDRLIGAGLIKLETVKYDKGWKKLVSITNDGVKAMALANNSAE
ncbi:ATP-binding protein [Candidatus Woesearchaeota archaeon]|nr:ATP-binding protein [Candidatus Woesearchaeota archaeon]